MRASISKPTPFIYLAFEKTDPFIYLIIQNVDLFIYCPFDFFNPFFAGYYTNITVNSCNTKRISSLEKSLSEKYVHIPGCQKNGAFHIGIQKNRAIHILFVEKRGPIIYLAALKKGAIRQRTHPYYATYRKLPPPPPPPPPPPTPEDRHMRLGVSTVQKTSSPAFLYDKETNLASSIMETGWLYIKIIIK